MEARRTGKSCADQKKRRERAARRFAAEEEFSPTEAQGTQERAEGKKTGAEWKAREKPSFSLRRWKQSAQEKAALTRKNAKGAREDALPQRKSFRRRKRKARKKKPKARKQG